MEISPIYTKSFTCPLCNHPFSSSKIRSRFLKTEGHQSDLRPIYQNPELDPNLYHVHVCFDCGFSFTEDFSPYFPSNAKQRIQQALNSNWKPQDFSGVRQHSQAIGAYKLAIFCALLKKEKQVILAGLYLRLSWLYSTIQSNDQQKRFQRLALHSYKESYSIGDYTGTRMSSERLLYLAADLSLQLNEEQEATTLFSKLIEQQNSATEPRIVKLAKERWQAYRAEKNSKSVSPFTS
ncbi:DUF2225 domain-containing protein [Jeotgalibacillus proteolyticus]|uniref:DUF2225 domain-containing protein n=1 Tax=Jeotgalibacillus proteolyticus TaxID=2082395 RepID=UPI003CEF0318